MERSGMKMGNLANEIQERLQGVDYPLDRSTAEDKLSGMSVGGKDITEYFDQVNWPIQSQDDLTNRLGQLQQKQMSRM